MTRSSRPRARRLGRRVGIIVFGVLVAVPTALWSTQIMRAVWAPDDGPAPPSCRAGLRQLLAAIERAKQQSLRTEGGELPSVARFRAALLPEWASRGALTGLCQRGEESKMLKTVIGLRYAEEHAVRYEATALFPQRAAARALKPKLHEPPDDP
jgi:hypothetical protein